MSESVKNLINAISVGSAIDTEESFNSAMAEKISVKLESMRQDVAANMFATEEDDDYYEAKQGMIEDSLNELSSNTLSPYGKKAEKSIDKKLNKAADHSQKATNLYDKGTASAVDKASDHENKANDLHRQVNKRNDSMDQAAGKLKKQMSKGMM